MFLFTYYSPTYIKFKTLIRWFFLLFAFGEPCLILAAQTNFDSFSEPKKVALLFLTRNGVNHPNLWKELLTQHADQFNIYLYSGTPLTDLFFEQFRVKKYIPTSWGNHVQAWQLLLQEAYANKENYKFVYLSESCVPIVSLDRIYQTLTQDDQSYMDFKSPWWPDDSIREVLEIPPEHRWGNGEWVTLNRRHAEMIVKDNTVIHIVTKHLLDIESYPSSLFSINQCLHEVTCYGMTYVNWSLPEGNGAHPYHFKEENDFNWNMLLEAKKQGYLFARKFTTTYPESAIFTLINTVH